MAKGRFTSRREFVGAGLALLPFLKFEACASAAETCRPTVRGAGGPFYKEGAPWRSRLCGANEPGEPLVVAGRVTGADTCAPLKGAVVDVWQADSAGRYDNERFHLRGRVKADDEGLYSFETILPGNYTDGGLARARHIHYIITAPGYAPLTTECYFEGEPRNRTDPIVRTSLIIPLNGTQGERRTATFDIMLAKAK